MNEKVVDEAVERCELFGEEQFKWLCRRGSRMERRAAGAFAEGIKALAAEVRGTLRQEVAA